MIKFSFKEIGNVIESLLDNLFKHNFSKLTISLDQTTNDLSSKSLEKVNSINKFNKRILVLLQFLKTLGKS